MMYEVTLTDKAKAFYKFIDPAITKKLSRCYVILEQSPLNHPNITTLKGNLSGFYRFRVGDYRVIYEVDDNNKQVRITNIAHRSEVHDT
jgi:mRNA interferase RelE/StbE